MKLLLYIIAFIVAYLAIYIICFFGARPVLSLFTGGVIFLYSVIEKVKNEHFR